MNLLQQMNADAFGQLLAFKEQFPELGADLINSLRYKTNVFDITLIECTYLSWAFNINGFDFFLNPHAFFQSKP